MAVKNGVLAAAQIYQQIDLNQETLHEIQSAFIKNFLHFAVDLTIKMV